MRIKHLSRRAEINFNLKARIWFTLNPASDKKEWNSAVCSLRLVPRHPFVPTFVDTDVPVARNKHFIAVIKRRLTADVKNNAKSPDEKRRGARERLATSNRVEIN